jgi:hypothetical protein
MKIEMEIDESLLSDAASSLFAENFSHQRFGKAFGTQLLEKQVQAYICQMDFEPNIKAAAKAKLDDVVNAVVEQALRDAVKKKAKLMQADGSLFT